MAGGPVHRRHGDRLLLMVTVSALFGLVTVSAVAPPSPPSAVSGDAAAKPTAYKPPTPQEVNLFQNWVVTKSIRSRSSSGPFVDPQHLALYGGPADTGVTTSSGSPGLIGGQSGGDRRRKLLVQAPSPSPSLTSSSSNVSVGAAVNAVVAKDGSGQFTSVQQAVNRAPGTRRYVVFIKRGTYTEKVTISKDYVTLRGEGPYLTILKYSDTAGSAGGTSKSASVTVTGDFFSSENLTYANGAPRPNTSSQNGQAVAFRITGDQAAFFNVRFTSYQDTLYSHHGRHYFKNCYIRGSVDFIFGNGTAMFLDSSLYADVIDKGGYLTAQKRGTALETTGFVFLRCNVNGNGLVYLGRPWGEAARTIFAYTYMSAVVQPTGWNDWGKNVSTLLTVFYGEYKNTGPGAATGQRVNWAYKLTDSQARPFLTVDFIQGKSWIGQSGLTGLTVPR